MLHIRKDGREDDDDFITTTVIPSAATSPGPRPSVTLYDGRVVPPPDPITLYDGRIVTPTFKPDGRLATEVEDYSTTTTIPSTFSPTSATSIPASAKSIPSSFSTATSYNSPSTFSTASITIPSSGSSSTDPFSPNDDHFWNNFSEGVKAGIILAIIIGFFSVIIASIWFCCGRPRRRRQKERESRELDSERERAVARNVVPGQSVERLPVPLRTMRSGEERPPLQAHSAQRNSVRNSSHGTGIGRVASRLGRHMSLRGGGHTDAPPRYEEVVPAGQQRLAGGIRNNTTEDTDDGMGLVADGKMPLSEIPFEDVVLEPARSEGSSSREFGERHHVLNALGGGDTRGHTNS